MRQKIKLFKESGLFMLIIMLLCSMFGVVDAGAMTADVVAGAEGGVIATDTVNTAQFARENSDDLLLNDIEKKVVKVNAGAAPMTQFAFYATKRSATSMIQEHYLTDVLPDNTTLKDAYTEPSGGAPVGVETTTINTNNNDIFSAKETVIFPEIKGYNENGTEETEQFFMAYILKKTDEGKLVIKAVNGKAIGGVSNSIPTLAAGTKMLRCGRAHNEIDMRTPAYAVVPTKKNQYLQIFRCQIEESTLEKIANKEVEWNFSDLEEAAVYDMKMGMSKNFLLGVKSKAYDESRREVYFTGGVYWQAKKKFPYAYNGQFTYEELVRLTEKAFTGGNGSKKKYFLVGSGLMTQLSLIKYAENQKPADKTHVRYGITFKEITTNFGTLYVVHDETFDRAGMRESGLIFDPSLLRKYSIYDMKATDLDLRKSGERDVDARTISEISGLVLQNPEAHIRVEKYVA